MAAGDLTATRSTLSNLPANVFDMVDDYIEVAHTSADLGTNLSNGFTFSFWMFAKSAGEGGAAGAGAIFSKSTTGESGQGIGVFLRGDTSKIYMFINSSAKITSTNAVTLNTWTHYLFTCTGGGVVTIYINGVADNSGATSMTLSTAIIATRAARIGNICAGTTNTFDGALSRIKMWNRILSASEITLDYADSPPMRGLIHYFKLGGDYTDYGSVGGSATNSGSYSNETLALGIKADIDKINNPATTDNAFLQVLTNYDRNEVLEVIKVVRA